MRSYLVIIAGFLLVLLLAGKSLFEYGVDQGQASEKAVWVGKELEWKNKLLAADRAHEAHVAALVLEQKRTSKETVDEYEQAVAKVRSDLAVARRRAELGGGLRLPASICAGADRAPAGPEAPGAGRDHEAGPETVQVPGGIAGRLWELAGSADEVSEQLRSCQSWIRKNGFYD